MVVMPAENKPEEIKTQVSLPQALMHAVYRLNRDD